MPPPRLLQSEWMDRDDLDPGLHRQALRGLARLNSVSLGAGMLWKALRAELSTEGPNTLLDVATGSGDLPLGLACRARQNRLPLAVTAIDRAPLALAEAEMAARGLGIGVSGEQSIRWVNSDALDDRNGLPAGHFDFVTCSLFLHHLTEEQAVRLLAAMAARTRRLLLVNDLDRGYWGAFVVGLASRCLTRSPVVWFDGPASMGAAFTRPEARELAGQAGLHGARVSWRWPCRWLLEYRPR